ncbi:tRNA threonylcarbamoyladenosine dehydratase [Christensenella tenuis]|jgi:tRNA threonylcarbamoyladenosine dehydratase|uniref:tRNA threonylcarbamoyladenosine dehydratase n=1 Tax=Christensenella tenuis TaxID=2763033 RepID=A0ABR7EDK0_9FIRM|nr:tRNA threonylcarbamoyladenosine dehydratase [Christensenella tenuis]MBC5647109.1 tRNA threonylcarbamoyladenosine dehydratase [Christensenella tenuis]
MFDDSRTVALLGEEGTARLRASAVAVFGVGGVGSFAAEALARAGIGTLCLIDNDIVKPSNCNRQLVALSSTVGSKKVEVMAARVRDINPAVNVIAIDRFYDEASSDEIFAHQFDFVIDAIDSLRAKENLILNCAGRGIEMISSMGAGNKLYPERFSVMDLFRTTCDPIAKILRKRLRGAGVKKLRVVCSDEPPRKTGLSEDGKNVPASISFVPSVCGLLMAGAAVRYLAGVEE